MTSRPERISYIWAHILLLLNNMEGIVRKSITNVICLITNVRFVKESLKKMKSCLGYVNKFPECSFNFSIDRPPSLAANTYANSHIPKP